MRIGINSRVLKQFGGDGILSLSDTLVDVVELSLAEVDFLRHRSEIVEHALEVKAIYGISYTVHAPYQDSEIERLRVDFGMKSSDILEIMKAVLDVAYEIEADTVVIHPGDMHNRRSFDNAIENIRIVAKFAEDYGIMLAVENIYTNELGVRRVAELPGEMLRLVEEVAMDNVGVNLDVGHANISAMLHSRSIFEWFELLKDYVIHMHVHNNYGLNGTPWDKHNPIDDGTIDYAKIDIKARNVILEVKRGERDAIINSLMFLKGIKPVLV